MVYDVFSKMEMFGPAGANKADAIMAGIAQNNRMADLAFVTGMSRTIDIVIMISPPYAASPYTIHSMMLRSANTFN